MTKEEAKFLENANLFFGQLCQDNLRFRTLLTQRPAALELHIPQHVFIKVTFSRYSLRDINLVIREDKRRDLYHVQRYDAAGRLDILGTWSTIKRELIFDTIDTPDGLETRQIEQVKAVERKNKYSD